MVSDVLPILYIHNICTHGKSVESGGYSLLFVVVIIIIIIIIIITSFAYVFVSELIADVSLDVDVGLDTELRHVCGRQPLACPPQAKQDTCYRLLAQEVVIARRNESDLFYILCRMSVNKSFKQSLSVSNCSIGQSVL